jgi:large subunit ribosomal protein L13
LTCDDARRYAAPLACGMHGSSGQRRSPRTTQSLRLTDSPGHRDPTREEKVSAVPTYTPKAGDTTRTWYVIDATDVVLGRLAVAAANLLRGKHKPTFTPNVDGGDFVVIINADKVAISGDKLQNKFAYRHSGFPGGLRARSLGTEMQKHPDRVVEKAIVGMLPHNKLSRQIQKKLKVYAGPEHPHTAQKPVPYEIKQVSQ